MVWASSKMSAEERDKLLNEFSTAIRARVALCRTAPYRPKVEAWQAQKKQSAIKSAKAPPRQQGAAGKEDGTRLAFPRAFGRCRFRKLNPGVSMVQPTWIGCAIMSPNRSIGRVQGASSQAKHAL